MAAPSDISEPESTQQTAAEAALANFHPIVRDWFRSRFAGPTDAQARGWPCIQSGTDTLIAAPTGSGKTLAAFLCAIDGLVREALQRQAGRNPLPVRTSVVYISPLKALSNDVQRNLEQPLREIRERALAAGYDLPEIRVELRTGDTSASRRAAIVRRPPHILVTTPESLYLMLTAEKSREILRAVRTIIVDEIHAVARDKRGAHLALTLERLDHLICGGNSESSHAATRSGASRRPRRIGLSATQRPIARVAEFLNGGRDCQIVDIGHVRELDLAVEVPDSELSAVCSHEQWAEVHARLCDLIAEHRSTIIFVNTRSMAERLTHHLCLRLGPDAVASHHGSLAKETRLRVETRLKSGELRAIVATASLELGIDIGHVNLVCQIGSPRSIAALLQRVGRSGHAVGALPKGRLFALTRDELLEALALIRAVRQGRLDPLTIPDCPFDILAQQIVAAVACEEWRIDPLFDLVRRAWPYRALSRADFDGVVAMLARGYGNRHRPVAYVYHDAPGGRLRARRAARIAAITSGGAIPEQPLYRVVNIEDNRTVGTLDEDFATEQGAGTIFLLGNTSWQIVHTRGLQVVVRDARGALPSMPFWFGEAPGRTLELSAAVSELRATLAERIQPAVDGESPNLNAALEFLKREVGGGEYAHRQAAEYVAVQQAALGVVPTAEQVVFERFFDDTGGMQLVIHAPFGTRINRAWGLALRKRFCRSFDFELQASADDDGIVLSLGPNQSCSIEQLFAFVTPDNAQTLLEQAFLQVPFFRTRWQWNANRSLAVLRNRMGKRVAPALQRMRGDDLLTSIFPASTQCFEHVTGDIELPDHPLVRESMKDCLHDVADLPGLCQVLLAIRDSRIRLLARDTREPSPFAYERLNVRPYAFLDNAGLLERRTRALALRRTLDLNSEELRDLTWLDEAAIRQAAREAWPLVRDADELHEALYNAGLLPAGEGMACGWSDMFAELERSERAAHLNLSDGNIFWYAREHTALIEAAYPGAFPDATAGAGHSAGQTIACDSVQARAYVLSGQLAIRPILTATQLSALVALPRRIVETQLEALEAGGGILRGHWSRSDASDEVQWCDRRLLQRIHRLTLESLRERIRPIAPELFFAYLLERHRLTGSRYEGKDGLLAALLQLQGFETAAGQWEAEILPARVADYQPQWLDELCLSGVATCGRMSPPGDKTDAGTAPRDMDAPRRAGMSRNIPLAFALREDLEWTLPGARAEKENAGISPGAQSVVDALEARGAHFPAELRTLTGLSALELDRALGELARLGRITADSFATFRAFVSPAFRRQDRLRRHRTAAGRRTAPGGRVALFPGPLAPSDPIQRAESWAQLLLERYGVIFRDLLIRETLAPPWRELAPVYRRLEVRGEIRGGRFVSGVSGEQFALPDAVERLRALRETPEREQDFVILSAADPLNLLGILNGHTRVASGRNVRLAFESRSGRHVASYDGGEITFHEELERAEHDRIFTALRLSGPLRQDLTDAVAPPVGATPDNSPRATLR